MSPLAVRRGDADPIDIAAGEVRTNALQLNYDANDAQAGDD